MRTSTKSTRSLAPAPCQTRIVIARFIMRPQQQQGQHRGPAPLSPRWVQEASDQARDTMNWLRYAVEHPDDVTAVAIGRMVSKEYGAHERAHTEQHRWRSASSLPTTPASPGATARPRASSAGGTSGAGWQPWSAGQPGEAGTAASPDLTPHSPPCGPGFLRQQQQQRSVNQQQ